jgi:hypothetical protein
VVERVERPPHLDQVRTCTLGGSANRCEELIGAHSARARRLDEDAVRARQPNGALSQLTVGMQSAFDARLALGE